MLTLRTKSLKEGMQAMRDLLWNYFEMTGKIGVYLLYKQHEEDLTERNVHAHS